jgi:hypothetical protein
MRHVVDRILQLSMLFAITEEVSILKILHTVVFLHTVVAFGGRNHGEGVNLGKQKKLHRFQPLQADQTTYQQESVELVCLTLCMTVG